MVSFSDSHTLHKCVFLHASRHRNGLNTYRKQPFHSCLHPLPPMHFQRNVRAGKEGETERDCFPQQYLAGCWLATAAGDAHLWLNSAQPAWRCLSQSDRRMVNTCCPAPYPLCPPHSFSNHPPSSVFPSAGCCITPQLSLSFSCVYLSPRQVFSVCCPPPLPFSIPNPSSCVSVPFLSCLVLISSLCHLPFSSKSLPSTQQFSLLFSCHTTPTHF